MIAGPVAVASGSIVRLTAAPVAPSCGLSLSSVTVPKCTLARTVRFIDVGAMMRTSPAA